jgi:hypothetical protein
VDIQRSATSAQRCPDARGIRTAIATTDIRDAINDCGYFEREVLMATDIIPSGSFSDGFEIGYRSIRGTAAGMPGIPGQPGTRGNMTPFLMGVRKGIESGLDKDLDDLQR